MKKIARAIFACLLLILSLTVCASLSLTVFADEGTSFKREFNFSQREVKKWLLFNASFDEEKNEYILTEDYQPWQSGAIWYNNNTYTTVDFTLELDYYTGSSDRSLGGADGIAIAFYANFEYTMVAGEDMGFTGSAGYGIELDTYYNANRGDPAYNHIALIKEDVGNHLEIQPLPDGNVTTRYQQEAA